MNSIYLYIAIMAFIFGLLVVIPTVRNIRFRNELIKRQQESMSEIQMVYLSSLSQEEIESIEASDILTPECVQLHTEFSSLEEIEAYVGVKVSPDMTEEQSDKLTKAIREHSTNPVIRDFAKLYHVGILMNSQKISQKFNRNSTH